MNKGQDLIKRQQPEIIDGFPTGNICIGVTKEELTELEKELKEGEKNKQALEIIKNLHIFRFYEDNQFTTTGIGIRAKKEEYELLKEVLL